MKKITLALTIFTFALQAQTFPSPYCDIDNGASIEEISSINFGETNITNSNLSALLIDQTATVVNVSMGETYTISVEGNTYGNFDTNIVAYIDWDQNGILDDDNEIYSIGTLSNSTGSDDIAVSMDITVPTDATAGTTRIRVVKTYTDENSVAQIDPCAISFNIIGYGVYPSFGQAIDFSLNIETLSVDEFETTALSVYPNPIKNVLNIDYKSDVSNVKIYNLLGQEVISKQMSSSKLQLDVSDLKTGVYIVTLSSKSEQHSFRVLKQ